ncbi:MAG: hypothetical protein L6Q97_21150 [Thermoanaerobaculia bacterium]|nr:hypothetical protein [Thermoanaerobaculia bacterium]
MALDNRIVIPSTRSVMFIAVIFLLFYIFLSVVLRPKNTEADYHFIHEQGAITALSAIFMAMATGMAYAAYFIAKQRGNSDRYLWILFALAFGYLTLDELLEIHEFFGGLMNLVSGMIGMEDTGIFRNWNDVVVIAYGVVALAFFLYYLPAILRYSVLGERLAVAGVFFVIHTVIDSVSEPQTVNSVILEESAKLYCALFLALSGFSALLGVIFQGNPNR